MSVRGRSFLATSLAITFLVCGCWNSGPRKYPVAGVVTFEGQPVPEGTVQFFSPKVGSSGVPLEVDGTFSFESVGGLQAGEYKVFVSPPELHTTPPPAGGPSMEKPKEYPNIPPRYRQAATTEFKVEIDGEKKDLEFDMKP
jgi:hypothetical protein